MTLQRQMLVGILAAFIALLLGIEVIFISNARHHLENQLDAHANETATSLALTMGSRMQEFDEVMVSTLINPVFDRGHFDLIEVKEADGRVVTSRRLEAQEIGLPNWFVGIVAFDPPTGQSLITAGWRQLGKVTVRVHPKFAYLQLWDTALATLAWLGVLFASALLAMRIYLAGILKPLGKIEEAAVAIGNRDFVTIDIRPRARELRRVTDVINNLSGKIRDAIAQESARAERLRREAFEDPTTGRFNRRGFDNALSSALVKSAEVHSGALVLFAIAGLDEVNRILGIARGNEIVRQLVEIIAAPSVTGAPVVGRWQGAIFAALMENVTQENATAWADGICRSFLGVLRAAGLPENVKVNSGIAHFSTEGRTSGALARLAERALAEAGARGGGAYGLGMQGAAPQTDIRHEIESALLENRVSLVFQKTAFVPDGEILQLEFYSRLTDSRGQVIAAGTFVPVASQHGLLPRLDLRVAQLVISAMKTVKNLPYTVSVNLAIQSAMDTEFREALLKMLRENGREARRIVFEVSGGAAGKSAELAIKFARELRRVGSRFALDNFEMDRNSIALASELMPAYIKLAPVFTKEIIEREDARFILEAMLRVFKPLEIPVIAQGVEEQVLVPVLTELGISGYQGYVLGRPEPLNG